MLNSAAVNGILVQKLQVLPLQTWKTEREKVKAYNQI